AELAPGRQLEVLNASVDGYGTAQELLLFRDRVARYDADLVLLQMFLGNDLTDNYAGSNPSHYLEQRCGRPYFTLEDGALEPLATPSDSKPKSPNLLDRMLRVSKLYGNLVSLPPKRPPRLRKLDIFRTAPHQPLEESWDLTQRLVLTLRDEVEARGSTLMVLVIPTKYEVHQKANPELVAGVHDLARPIQRLERFLEGADIPFINMAPFLETAIVDRGTQPYFEIDSHLRSEGHALLAHEIRVFLLEHCKTLGLPAAGCAS
ncbi:MAG: SGNH/GDSL hydrolase family protein, partial [Deltaproteobacteria bacterium]